MNNISSGIFTVDEDLVVHPGYSAATRRLLDIESTDEPVYFSDVLNNLAQDTRIAEGFLPWVKLIYSDHILDWHKDILPICNCNESQPRMGAFCNLPGCLFTNPRIKSIELWQSQKILRKSGPWSMLKPK